MTPAQRIAATLSQPMLFTPYRVDGVAKLATVLPPIPEKECRK